MEEAQPKERSLRSALIISKSDPKKAEPGTPIGYWSEEIMQEARRRGAFPVVQISWPEDLALFAAAKAAELTARIANDNLSQDPVVAAIAERVAETAPQVGQLGTPPFLMKLEDYANRCGYSVAFIKRLIPRGLPTLGIHKARRVHVARADRWLEQNLDVLDVTDSADVEDLAKANARKKAGGQK